MDAIRTAPRVCFFAHYHQGDLLADHVVLYLGAIRDAGFTIVVLSTANVSVADEARLAAMGIALIRRANEGLDFGGWIEACRRFFPIEAELLLLANDSVYAPVGDFAGFLDRLLAHPADVYGAIESNDVKPHLQSWFLLFRPSAYRSDRFRELMCEPMPRLDNKWALIERYEVTLSRGLREAGLRIHAAMSMASRGGIAGRHAYNPTHLVWRELIDDGIPFLKIELLRFNPMRVANVSEWREVVGARRPELVAMIEDDLQRRPPVPPPSSASLSEAGPVCWPEARPFVRADFRRGRRREPGSGLFIRAGFYATLAMVAVPRLAWRAWMRRRHA